MSLYFFLALALLEPSAADTSLLLNVNTATREQLSALPGIDANIATNIICARDHRGSPFTSCADLLEVYDVDRVTVVRICPYVTFDVDSRKTAELQ